MWDRVFDPVMQSEAPLRSRRFDLLMAAFREIAEAAVSTCVTELSTYLTVYNR